MVPEGNAIHVAAKACAQKSAATAPLRRGFSPITPAKPVQELGEDEILLLEITAAGATLNAANTAAPSKRASRTILHLVKATPPGTPSRFISIQDKPVSRGEALMVPTSAAIYSASIPLRRTLDGMEAVPCFNVFPLASFRQSGIPRGEQEVSNSKRRLRTETSTPSQKFEKSSTTRRPRHPRHPRNSTSREHCTAMFIGYPELRQRARAVPDRSANWGVNGPRPSILLQEGSYKFLSTTSSVSGSLSPTSTSTSAATK